MTIFPLASSLPSDLQKGKCKRRLYWEEQAVSKLCAFWICHVLNVADPPWSSRGLLTSDSGPCWLLPGWKRQEQPISHWFYDI